MGVESKITRVDRGAHMTLSDVQSLFANERQNYIKVAAETEKLKSMVSYA